MKEREKQDNSAEDIRSEDIDPARETGEYTSDDKAVDDEAGMTADEEKSEGEKKISFAEYEELKTLAAERDDYLKRLRRAVANTMSLQKRIEKVRQNAEREALRQLARKVVPLADSLARARQNAENTEGAEKIAEGIGLTEKEFYNILAELDIHPIQALGEPFDPAYHEAVMQEPREGCEPNTVVQELKKGFMLGEALLRPAQVVVSIPVADKDGSEDE
jgi:molecular chaperone GrpE